MKKTALIIFLHFLTYNIIAQNITIVRGERFEQDNSFFNYFIGNDSTGFYTKRTSLKGTSFKHIIHKTDKATLKTIYIKDLGIAPSEKVIKTFLKKNRLMVFTSKFAKKEGRNFILLREFDPMTGNITDSTKVVSSYNCIQKELDNCVLNIIFSPDNLKMAIINGLNKDGMFDFSVTLYEVAASKKIGMSKTVKSTEKLYIRRPEFVGYDHTRPVYNNLGNKFEIFKLKNDGTLFCLFNNVMDYTNGNIAYACIPVEATEVEIKTINLEHSNTKTCMFEFVNEGILISGIFKDAYTKQEKKQGKTENIGIYTALMNPATMELKSQATEYFPKDVIDKLTYSDAGGRTAFEKFYFPRAIFTLNNSIYLIETHVSANLGANTFMDYDREFIISKITLTGKVEWIKAIPKYTTNALNGFNYIIRNNKVYLIYAEKPENLKNGTVDNYDPKQYDYIYHYNNSVLACTSFDESGVLQRVELPESKNWFYEPTSSNISLEKENGLIIKMLNNAEERYDEIIIAE